MLPSSRRRVQAKPSRIHDKSRHQETLKAALSKKFQLMGVSAF
jgi:hypothetical protein